MAERDLLRQKRERDFQARVLAALEKPKSNRLFVILNSAFFLWILTAACLAIGGTVFTQRQKCSNEAFALTQRYYALDREFLDRDAYLSRAVRDATSIEDLLAARDRFVSTNSELRTSTLADRNALRRKILLQVDPSTLPAEWINRNPDDDVESALTNLSPSPGALEYAKLVERESSIRFNAPVPGSFFSKRAKRLQIQADCSLPAVFGQLLNGDIYILRADFR